MKIGNKILYIFISFLFSVPNNVIDSYEFGLSSYKESNYKLAIHEFESIIGCDWYSEELLYNLGNSYYKNHDISNAIWAYEQTLEINPRNKDALFNLELAKSSTKKYLICLNNQNI